MKISDAGLNVIKKWEGLRLVAYADPATGGEPYTIGYGHTSRAGAPKVVPGMRISVDEALAILKADLGKFEASVNSMLTRVATQAQFDAMVSLTYNIGAENFRKSTVLRKFNAGDARGAAEAFMLFVKANGKTLKGLVTRRAEERELFLIGTGTPIIDMPPDVTPKADAELIVSEPKPVMKSRRVWASIVGWLGGGGVATFASFSGFDWRALLVLVVAIFSFILFFWFMYRREIEQGLFSK